MPDRSNSTNKELPARKKKRRPERFNFNKKNLVKLAAPEKGRAIYYDSQEHGLGIMVQPTGHKAFFWYRFIRGRPTWKTLGTFPDMSIENARQKAQEYNAGVARWKADDYQGPDPLGQHGTVTLGTVLDDYIEKHVAAKAKDPDRAAKAMQWQFDRYLKHWEDRRLGDIRRADIQALHSEIGSKHGRYGPKNGDEKEVAKKHGKTTANRVHSLIRALYNWAIRNEQFTGENPAKGIARFHEQKRTRFTQPNELPRLFRALQKEPNLDVRDFVLLALMTGARRANVLAMRWEQLDLGRGTWTIPNPKNREPYTVPLVDEASALLRQRRRRVQGEWVFPSDSKSGHLTEVRKGWGRLLKQAKLKDLRVHDLRRTLGSWQAAAGVSLPIIGKTLGHEGNEATQIYARLHLDPVREAITQATQLMFTAGKMDKQKLLGGKVTKQKVLEAKK